MSSNKYVRGVTFSKQDTSDGARADGARADGAEARIAAALLKVRGLAAGPRKPHGASGRLGYNQKAGSHAHHGHHHRHRGRHGRGAATARLLLALEEASDPMGVSEVGALIGVDQPRASRLVAQAMEEGLLQRHADPNDARRALIRLTGSGQEAARGLRVAREEQVARALTQFTPQERSQLAELLERLAASWD